jgi:hypothetical protein
VQSYSDLENVKNNGSAAGNGEARMISFLIEARGPARLTNATLCQSKMGCNLEATARLGCSAVSFTKTLPNRTSAGECQLFLLRLPTLFCMNYWILQSNPDILDIDTLDWSAHQTRRRRGITLLVAKASQRRSSLTRQNEAMKLRERCDGFTSSLSMSIGGKNAQLAICNQDSGRELARWRLVTKSLMLFPKDKPRVLKLRLKTRGGSECMSQ